MNAPEASELGLLLDIDGVLYVDGHPVEGAREALAQLREMSSGLRLVTNTTSRSRREVFEQLQKLDFEVAFEEVLTPAAMAVSHCRERGYESVALLVSEKLREDLSELEDRAPGEGAEIDAVILGDLGKGFTPEVLNDAFRLMMDGAELVALQHNRYWRRGDGLALDVGAYASALEYATGHEALVVGKPAREFFLTAMADIGVEHGLMVGDDVEADV